MSATDSSKVRPGRLLVIDDDEQTSATFATMLRLAGHDVQTMQDARGALGTSSLPAPDAIIVDLQMPAMDGLTFVRQLRAQESGAATPVAVVTGDYTISQTLADALKDLGVTVYFKPLWFEDLIAVAGQLLQERS